MTKTIVCLLTLLSHGLLCAQTAIDLRTQTKNVDFSSAATTKPFKTGTVLPASCTTGETFFKSDATPGRNLFGCVAANTWSLLSGDYTAGSGITITGGVISTDDAVTPVYYSGSGLPAIGCIPGRDYYVDTTSGNLYFCQAANSWSKVANSVHTHQAGDVTSGQFADARVPASAVTQHQSALQIGASQIVSGVHPLARGGTNQSSWTANRCVQVSSDGSRLESAAGACGGGGGAVTATYVALPFPDSLFSTSTTNFGAVNRLFLTKVMLPASIQVNDISIRVNTGAAGASIYAGLYSADGATKLLDSGPIDASSAGAKTATLAATVSLQPGTYWLAYGATDANVSVFVHTSSSNAGLLVHNEVQYGYATNPISGGLPATLGGVSTGSYMNPIQAKLEN